MLAHGIHDFEPEQVIDVFDAAGIKKPDRRDLVVIEVAEGSRVAGSFTLNAFCAAPVVVAKQNLAACGAHDAWPTGLDGGAWGTAVCHAPGLVDRQ